MANEILLHQMFLEVPRVSKYLYQSLTIPPKRPKYLTWQ